MTTADFNNMVVMHGSFLHPYAISLTQDAEDAKDLYQETMLRALLNKEKYQFGTNLKAWMYTIMRNIFINNYRRSRKFKQLTFDILADTTVYKNETINYYSGWSKTRVNEVKAAIDSLPETLRLAFELHYTGYKYNEISILLKEPLGTIKSRIHFARKQLMSSLDR